MSRILTGVQSTGTPHLGNLLGAIIPAIKMANNPENESFLFIADMHSLTQIKNGETLRQNTYSTAATWLAFGLDVNKTVFYRQSDIPEVTELSWYLSCFFPYQRLTLAHSFKDKADRLEDVNAGLFNYPMLMAADILLYDAEVVPVGSDQRQHIEYTREVAGKFNREYGKTFTPPKEKILESVGVVPGIDGKKMSKSYKNTIPLFGTKEEIEKAVMSIVTDSEGKKPKHVYAIHRLFKTAKELEPIYKENEGKYGNLKKILLSDIEEMIAPMREKRNTISDSDVHDVLIMGAKKARKRAEQKMREVRQKLGVAL